MAGMGMKLDYQGIDHLNDGIGTFFKALAAAPLAEQQAKMKSALQDSQTYAHNMQGNKFGAEAEGLQLTNKNRTGILDGTTDVSSMPTYAQQALKVFGLTGEGDPNNIANASGEFQRQDIRKQALDAVDPANPTRMNMLNVLTKDGATYEPFKAIGNTGYAVNGATGGGTVASETLAKLFGENSAANTAKEKAQAFQANASGQHQLASRDKVRQDIDMGAKGQIVQGPDGPLLVDPRNPASARLITTPDGQAVGPKLKDIPATANNAIMENAAAVRKIDDALALVTKKPGAFGLQNKLGNTIMSRVDPDGVDARAIVADIGSLKLHDRSGAAITASESPRLIPFIPTVDDDAPTIKKKLAQFKREYEATQADMNSMYSKEQGYKPAPSLVKGGAQASANGNAGNAGGTLKIASKAQYDALAKGTRYVAPDGVERIKQ